MASRSARSGKGGHSAAAKRPATTRPASSWATPSGNVPDTRSATTSKLGIATRFAGTVAPRLAAIWP